MQAPDSENEKKATAITMKIPDIWLKMKAAAKWKMRTPDSEYDVRRYTRSRQPPTHKAHDDTIPWHQIKQKSMVIQIHGANNEKG